MSRAHRSNVCTVRIKILGGGTTYKSAASLGICSGFWEHWSCVGACLEFGESELTQSLTNVELPILTATGLTSRVQCHLPVSLVYMDIITFLDGLSISPRHLAAQYRVTDQGESVVDSVERVRVIGDSRRNPNRRARRWSTNLQRVTWCGANRQNLPL